MELHSGIFSLSPPSKITKAILSNSSGQFCLSYLVFPGFPDLLDQGSPIGLTTTVVSFYVNQSKGLKQNAGFRNNIK